jgi:alpha-glucosidase
LAVDVQEADPQSLLHLTRRLITLRQAHPALKTGGLQVLVASDDVLVFTRGEGADRVLCAFNMGAVERAWQPETGNWTMLAEVNGASLGSLSPFGALIASRIG